MKEMNARERKMVKDEFAEWKMRKAHSYELWSRCAKKLENGEITAKEDIDSLLNVAAILARLDADLDAALSLYYELTGEKL